MNVRFLAIAALCLALGCGPSPTVPVTGTVTLDGQPMPEAEVVFTPAKGRVATGVTDNAGKFKLSTNAKDDGAVPGEHIVTVVQYYPPGKPPPMSGGPPPRFPAKYGDPAQAPFKVTVERGKANDFPLEMKK